MTLPHEDPAEADEATEIARWRAALIQAGGGRFASIEVLATVDSTQDHLRRRGAADGRLVTALRQTAGRGRLGRRWLDHSGAGVALSVAVPLVPVAGPTSAGPTSAGPTFGGVARLMMLSGLAVLAAIDGHLRHGQRSGLKWPNDVLVDGRKIAGSLVEVFDGIAVLGIGINVGQRDFDGPLAVTATSLALLGQETDRCAVAADLVRALVDLETRSPQELKALYQSRDLLRGTHRVFDHAGQRVAGVVQEVDPLGRIRIIDEGGALRELDAGVTTLVGEVP